MNTICMRISDLYEMTDKMFGDAETCAEQLGRYMDAVDEMDISEKELSVVSITYGSLLMALESWELNRQDFEKVTS